MSFIKGILVRFLIFVLWDVLGTFGRFVERTPLKICSSGFWAERYAREGLKIIRAFEEEGKPEEKLAEYENRLRRVDWKMYGVWVLLFSLVLDVWWIFFGLVRGYGTVGTLVGIGSVLLVHEFACPSAVRKYQQLVEQGEVELAEIIGKRASPSCLAYFKRCCRMGQQQGEEVGDS